MTVEKIKAKFIFAAIKAVKLPGFDLTELRSLLNDF